MSSLRSRYWYMVAPGISAAAAISRMVALAKPFAAITFDAPSTMRRQRSSTTSFEKFRPIHVGPSISIWRAVVFREEEQIADVTQTQMAVASRGWNEAGAREERTNLRAGAIGQNFSKEVVDERWRRIVEGASKVIAAKGFAKATIREIAAAADMPVATMYQYLERKEDILYNVYKFFMTDIVASLKRWQASDVPPNERLAGAIRTMVDVFDKNHRFIKLMFQET